MHLEQKNEAEVTDMCSFLKQVGVQYASRCSLALMVEDKKRTDPYKAGRLEYSVTRRAIRFMGDRDGVQYNVTERKWEIQPGAACAECNIWYSILRAVLNSSHTLAKYRELEFPVATDTHAVGALLDSSEQLFSNVRSIRDAVTSAIKNTLYWTPEVNVSSSHDKVFVRIRRETALVTHEAEYEYSHNAGWERSCSTGSPCFVGVGVVLKELYPAKPASLLNPPPGPASLPTPTPQVKHLVADLDDTFKRDRILRDNIKSVLEGVLRKRVVVHRADGGITVIVRQSNGEPNLKFTWTPSYGWKADSTHWQGPVYEVRNILDKIFPRVEEK